MSHRGLWAIKDPDELKDYAADWAGTADDPGIAYGDPISSSEWILPAGDLVNDHDVFTATGTTIWLSGGTAGKTYELTNRVQTTGGRTYDETFKLKVANK